MATLGIPDTDPLTGLPRKKQQSMFAPTDQSQVPGLPAGVTNGNLASTLFGIPGTVPTGGGQPGGGGNSFQSLINSLLAGTRANITAADTADIAGRNAAINRGIVQLGMVPDTAAASNTLGFDLGSIISPDTAQLAQSNPFSTSKQIDQANTDAIRQIRRTLAARGGLQSGDLGYGLQKQQDSYSQAKYNATQQLLDYIAGVQHAYVEQQRQRQAALDAQQMNYAQLIASLFPNGIPGGGDSGGGGGSGGSSGGDQGGGGSGSTGQQPGGGGITPRVSVPSSVSGTFEPSFIDTSSRTAALEKLLGPSRPNAYNRRTVANLH